VAAVGSRRGENTTASTPSQGKTSQAARLRRSRYERILTVADDRLTNLEERLDALKPERVLRRGYAMLRDDAGRLVTSVAAATPGRRLTTTLADGQFTSLVTSHIEETADPQNDGSPAP